MNQRRQLRLTAQNVRHTSGRMVASLAILVSFSALSATAAAAQGQFPEKFENLQVFPKDIARDSLQTVMRGFTAALGVRCSFCHVESEATPPQPDYKANKKKARFMLKMVQNLNGTVLTELPDRSDPAVDVTCATCHHGQSRPRTLETVLAEVIQRQDVDAAIARYRALRERFYGRDTYDFGAGSLIALAGELTAGGKPDDAVRVLELDLEFYPTDGNITFAIGETYRQKGDNAKALEFYRKTLEIQPNNRRAQQMIQRMGGG
jgi:tetratricopeptide (TPR) repeat protein